MKGLDILFWLPILWTMAQRGRPTLYRRPLRRCTVDLPESMWDGMTREADRLGISRAELFRRLAEHYLDCERSTPEGRAE